MNHLQNGTEMHGLVTQTVATSDLGLLHRHDVGMSHVTDVSDVETKVE